MEVKVNINTCYDCRHLGHSGSFTHGGARNICDHDEAYRRVRVSKTRFKKMYPMYKSHTYGEGWKYHWIHRIVEDDNRQITGIPDWCPLKHGGSY